MKAIVTVGLPGCGKSTYAEGLDGKYVEINLDKCREIVNGDAADQSNIQQVIAYRDSMIEQAAKLHADIIVSDTNLHPEFRKGLISDLKKLGYKVTLTHFTTSLETCMKRNKNRDRQVPDHAMIRMHDQLQKNPVNPKEADHYVQVD